MDLGQTIRLIMRKPTIKLRSRYYAAEHTLGVTAEQFTHKDVPFSNVKTLKLTIGAPGVAGCDFNFASAENTTEQVIDLGAIVPAFARILDVKTITEVAFSAAATTLVMETGTSSSGNQLIASATILAANAITQVAAAAGCPVAVVATAGHVYCAATPGANWSGIVAGKVAVYVSYIEI